MGRYDFKSVGGEAGNAIQAFIIQRAIQARQQQQDAVAKQERDDQAKRQADDLKLRQDAQLLRRATEEREAGAQRNQQDDLANQREFTRATTIADRAMPGDVADPETAALLQKQGLGGQVKKVPGVVSQGTFKGNDENEIPQYDVSKSPDSFTMRGGSQYIAARTAADERSAEHDKDLNAKETQGEADRQLRELIARMSASTSAESAGLRNDLLKIQTQMAQDKLDAGRKATTDAAGAVKTSRSSVRDMAQSLLDDPALDGITGPVSGRRDTFFEGTAVDAKKRLDQLVGQLSLQARGQMKGQGQISDFEGRLLQNAVSAIDRAAGPEEVKKHLKEIVDAFSGDAPQNGPATNDTATAKPSGFRVVGVR